MCLFLGHSHSWPSCYFIACQSILAPVHSPPLACTHIAPSLTVPEHGYILMMYPCLQKTTGPITADNNTENITANLLSWSHIWSYIWSYFLQIHPSQFPAFINYARWWLSRRTIASIMRHVLSIISLVLLVSGNHTLSMNTSSKCAWAWTQPGALTLVTQTGLCGSNVLGHNTDGLVWVPT